RRDGLPQVGAQRAAQLAERGELADAAPRAPQRGAQRRGPALARGRRNDGAGGGVLVPRQRRAGADDRRGGRGVVAAVRLEELEQDRHDRRRLALLAGDGIAGYVRQREPLARGQEGFQKQVLVL